MPQLGKNPEDQILPAVSLNETLTLKTVSPSQHFTKPPARFTEAALVKELEKRGIGRPSTYAAIISTIQELVMFALKIAVSMQRKWAKSLTDPLKSILLLI